MIYMFVVPQAAGKDNSCWRRCDVMSRVGPGGPFALRLFDQRLLSQHSFCTSTLLRRGLTRQGLTPRNVSLLCVTVNTHLYQDRPRFGRGHRPSSELLVLRPLRVDWSLGGNPPRAAPAAQIRNHNRDIFTSCTVSQAAPRTTTTTRP